MDCARGEVGYRASVAGDWAKADGVIVRRGESVAVSVVRWIKENAYVWQVTPRADCLANADTTLLQEVF